MVPVVPFSVLFAAIVSAQLPECYTRSHAMWVCGGEPPKPAELSIVLVPVPSEAEWLNHDVWHKRTECRFLPRLPPHTIIAPTLTPDDSPVTCTREPIPDWADGPAFRVQHCLPDRSDICPIGEIPPRTWGPEPSVQAWVALMPAYRF